MTTKPLLRNLLILSPALSLVAAAPGTDDFSYLKNKMVDLRPQINQMGMTPRDQTPRGTCTIFATTFLIEYWTGRTNGLKNVDYSEEYLAAAARRASTDKSDNYFFSEAAQGYEEYGIVDEKEVPYQKAKPINTAYLQDDGPVTTALLEKGKNNRILESEILISINNAQGKPGLSDEQFKRILMELDAKNPVAVGFAGCDNNSYLTKPNLKAPILTACFKGSYSYAHTVPLVGYVLQNDVPGGGYFIMRDSAGPNVGDSGYRYMGFDYIKRNVYDVLIFSKTLPSVVTSVNKDFIQKRWLQRKDILRAATLARQRVNVPFVTAEKLKTVLVTEARR